MTFDNYPYFLAVLLGQHITDLDLALLTPLIVIGVGGSGGLGLIGVGGMYGIRASLIEHLGPLCRIKVDSVIVYICLFGEWVIHQTQTRDIQRTGRTIEIPSASAVRLPAGRGRLALALALEKFRVPGLVRGRIALNPEARPLAALLAVHIFTACIQ